MADLDEIMAGRNASASDPAPVQSPAPESNPPPEPVQQQDDGPHDEAEPGQEAGVDPVTGLRKALDAERGKGRKYKEELASVREELSGFKQQFQGFMTAFQAQRGPQQPQQEKPKPDLWDDPNAFVGNTVNEALNPVQQALDFNSRLIAQATHTPDKVSEAEQAFLAAYNSGQLDPRDYHAVVGSPNRYHAAVEWYGRRPEAVRASLEAEIEASILAKYGIAPGQTPPAASPAPAAAPTAQNMPTSFAGHRSAGPRTAPQWTGPQALSDIMKR